MADQLIPTEDGDLAPSHWLRRQVKVHAYIYETVVLIGVLAVGNLAWLPSRPGFFGIEPHPFWVIILLMVARYGFNAGLLSSMLSAAVYLLLVGTRAHDELVSWRDLASWTYAKPAILFLVGGIPLGMLVQRHRDRLQRLEEENRRLTQQNETLKQGETALRDVNVELANRVIGATDTLPILYKFAKKLNVLDIDQILIALTELVNEVIKAEQSSIYIMNQSKQLVLHSRNGRAAADPVELRLEPALWQQIVEQRQIMSLHDLLALNIQRGDFVLCGPLTQQGQGDLRAVLVVEQLDFLRYNPATVRLFHVIIDWAIVSLEKAAQYQDQPEARRQREAKKALYRAQRASTISGVVTASEVHDAVGQIDTAAHPRQSAQPQPQELQAAGGISARPTSVGGSKVTGFRGVSSLGELLDEAHERLFGEVTAGEAVLLTSEDQNRTRHAAASDADPQSMAMLQHMLSDELEIARESGSPLAKLLAEINGYVSRQTGGKER